LEGLGTNNHSGGKEQRYYHEEKVPGGGKKRERGHRKNLERVKKGTMEPRTRRKPTSREPISCELERLESPLKLDRRSGKSHRQDPLGGRRGEIRERPASTKFSKKKSPKGLQHTTERLSWRREPLRGKGKLSRAHQHPENPPYKRGLIRRLDYYRKKVLLYYTVLQPPPVTRERGERPLDTSADHLLVRKLGDS